MTDIAALVTNHLDIWTAATERGAAGRGGGKRVGFYGVERLRALILNLAVRGRLVPQNVGDEPASELLKRIQRERKDKHFVFGRKSEERAAAGRTERVDDAGPRGWVNVPLAEILIGHVGGGTPSKTDPRFWNGSVPWASVKDVGKTKFINDTEDRITELGLASSSSNLIPAGSLILVTRMGVGQLSINNIDIAINQDLRALFLPASVNRDYCYNFFQTLKLEGSGMTVKGIKLDDLLATPFSLPPLAEQRRIVARVDELMALCDALERESADALAAHQMLVESFLATLVASPDVAALTAEWPRLESCFDTLFTTEASIDALKATMLELAVRGKLVSHGRRDDWITSELSELIGPMDSGWSPACHGFPARDEETWGVLKTTAVQYLSY